MLDLTVTAAANNPLVNASNFAKEGIQAAALVVVGAVAMKFWAQKAFTKLIGFVCTSAIILMIIFNPSLLTAFGNFLWHTVLGM